MTAISKHIFPALSLLIFLLCCRGAFAQQSDAGIPQSIAAPSQDELQVDAKRPSASSTERWDKLSLADNTLHADEPLVGEIDRYPEFTRQILRLQWRGGDPIDVYIVRPVGIARPPVILYLYGYPQEGTRFLNDNLCRTVTRNGFAAIGFSSVLTGQRYHDVPMKEWFVSDLQQALAGTTHDVQMVLSYVVKSGDFDSRRIGVFGSGSGGTIAVLAASVDPRIKAVDILDPWGDWPEWLATSPLVPDAERPEYLKHEFLDPLASLDLAAAMKRLDPRSLRVQQTMFDTITPDPVKEKIAASVPASATVTRYRSQQEYLDTVGSNGRLLDWLQKHLPKTEKTAAMPPTSAAKSGQR